MTVSSLDVETRAQSSSLSISGADAQESGTRPRHSAYGPVGLYVPGPGVADVQRATAEIIAVERLNRLGGIFV